MIRSRSGAAQILGVLADDMGNPIFCFIDLYSTDLWRPTPAHRSPQQSFLVQHFIQINDHDIHDALID